MKNGQKASVRWGRQAGISLTEAILGVATLGVGLGVIAQIQTDNLENIRQETTAQQMKILLNASKSFVRDYYGPLVDGCGGPAPAPACPTGSRDKDGSPIDMPSDIFSVAGLAPGDTLEITADALFVAGYIDAGQLEQREHPVTLVPEWLFKKNSYGADVLLTVTNTGAVPGAVNTADRLRMQLVTRGGAKLSDKKGAALASKIGPDGGFRPADETLASEVNLGSSIYQSNTVYGAFGNWTIATADMGGAGLEPQTGGVAAVAYFGEGGVVSDFLYRNSVPGQPEAQRMNANINANGFGIGNVTQIGATAAGDPTNNPANPDMTDTNTAPEPITATFGAASPLNVAGATADNTVRFGDALASGFGGLGATTARYDRGNVNVQANDMLGRNIDAADAVRGLQRVEAGDRENDAANRGQRFGLYSGFSNTGAATANPALRGIDNNDNRRVEQTFSREVSGAPTVGTGSDVMRDGLNQERVRNAYNAATGDLTLKDDLNQDRLRAAYTDPNTGNVTLRDGANQRFTTAYATAAGNLSLTDNTGAERARIEYDRTGVGVDSGAQRLRQQNGTDRYTANYNGTTGSVIMNDEANRERFRNEYDGSLGFVQQSDDTAQIRMRSRYPDANTGELFLRDGAGQTRHSSFYDAASSTTLMNDSTGAARVITNSGNAGSEATTEYRQPSGVAKVRVGSGDNASGGTISVNQQSGREKIALAGGNNAQASNLILRDNNVVDARNRVVLNSGLTGPGSSSFVQLNDQNGNQTALLAGALSNGAYLELGNASNTDQTYIQRIENAADNTTVHMVIGDNPGTGVINSDGAADSFNVTALGGANSRFRVESDGAVGINTDAPGARLDVNCNAGDANCVRWNNNGTSTMNHASNANAGSGYTRLGSVSGPLASPVTPNGSVLDVDDVYLRSRGIWLSEANRFRVVDIQIVGDGGVAGGAVPAGCASTVAVVSPNSWASPVPRARIRADGTDIGGSAYTAVRTYTTSLGGTGWRVNIEGRGRSIDEGGNPLGDSGWRSINDARATVTVYCYN